MCGISGFNWPDKQLIERMNRALAHRGPDDQGFYQDDCVSLGHRRLSVIDTSERGHQPMTIGDYTLIYNGEVYNFKELRAELEAKGVRFRSDTDTEVILQAFIQWGDDCVQRFNGMWALCLYDKRNRRLLLSRDRFGIKPLYYYFDGKRFIFASELKAILQHDIEREMNPQALNFYFYQKYIGRDLTIWKNCFKLPPSENLIFDLPEKILTRTAHYNLDEAIAVAGQEPLAQRLERIEQTLSSAVDLRLISDVPVGSFLSGGVDSSLISAMIAKDHKKFKTFSIGFTESSYDELPFSRRVAQHIGTDHLVETLDIDDTLIEQIVTHLDEPFGDASLLPTALLSRMTRQQVTVALSGDAADEVFAGYDSYMAWQLARWIPRWSMTAAAPLLNALSPSDKKLSATFKLKKFVNDFHPNVQRRHLNWMATCNESLRKSLLPESFVADSQLLGVTPERSLESLQRLDIAHYLAEDILKKVDVASMRYSLEVRVPFLDHRLVPLVLSLPRHYRLRRLQTKWLLKQISRSYLPPEILRRKKRGFTVPISNWLQNSDLLQTWLTEPSAFDHGWIDYRQVQSWLKAHQSRRADFARPLWLVFVLNRWWANQGKGACE